MIQYLFSKAAYYLSLLLGIVFFSFILFHTIPSDPARTILGPNAGQQQVEQLRKEMGLDKPHLFQFAQYVKNAAILDFGKSYVDGRLVAKEIIERLKISLSLVLISLIFTLLYLVIVTFSSLFPKLKQVTHVFDFLLTSQPVFFSGIIVAIFTLYYYPVTSFSGSLTNFKNWLFLLPAAIVISFYPMAILSSILKKELSVVQHTSYMTAGRAMGFSKTMLLCKYALKNCLIPLLSALSNILPSLLTGAFIVEIIFSIPGIGSILIKSILERDFPMLECTIIVNGAFFILVNLLFEIIYPLVDHRIVGGKTL